MSNTEPPPIAKEPDWPTLCVQLAAIDFPTMRHMAPSQDHPERYLGIRQMLSDLNRLAREDGCIAAAWALDVIPTLHHALITAIERAVKLETGKGVGHDESRN